MLSGNFCDLELQTNNIEWGSGEFSTVYCAIKRVVIFGTLKVLLKDNVSTNYVADCSLHHATCDVYLKGILTWKGITSAMECADLDTLLRDK